MDKQERLVIFRQLLSRRRFLALLWELAVVVGIVGYRPSFASLLQQSSAAIGYGQDGYGQNEYPARIEHYIYMPIVTKKEN